MVVIKSVKFGFINVDDKSFSEDIVICGDKVFERPKHLSRKYRSIYGHTPLSNEELEYIINSCSDFDTIIIGTGHYGELPIMDDARLLLYNLSKKGKDIIIDRTPKVAGIVNDYLRQGRKVLALLHLTC